MHSSRKRRDKNLGYGHNIRKKGFGPGETQAALGNFISPRVYVAPWVAPGISRCL